MEPKFGKFLIAPDRQIPGELRISGKDTSLYLHDDKFFEPPFVRDGYLTGILHDLTRVTLLQCVTLEGRGTGGSYGGEIYHSARFFPHFVLEGRQHIGPNDKVIAEVRFVIDDAAMLFYDFDAFGSLSLTAANSHIERIATANNLDRVMPIGPEPQIAYFAGKRTIIEADTVLGKIRVQHDPWGGTGSPHGVRIDNVISIRIEPESPIGFSETISATLQLLHFLELIVGRPQNVRDLAVYIHKGERREPLSVHWSYCPSREADSIGDRWAPAPGDLLLDSIGRPEEFATVMSRWLKLDEERKDARERFYSCFKQRKYSVERLVGAANMFDILPASAVPKDVELSAELLNAKQHCREIFRTLPESYERSSVLNALGRVGKASLKHKTAYRATFVIDAVGDRFPDLILVLNEAIDCRNHYVHGTVSRIDYMQHFNVVTFFTNTLEFVFAASELIEAGWNIREFIAQPTSMTHPFGMYKVDYKAHLETLKAVLA